MTASSDNSDRSIPAGAGCVFGIILCLPFWLTVAAVVWTLAR